MEKNPRGEPRKGEPHELALAGFGSTWRKWGRVRRRGNVSLRHQKLHCHPSARSDQDPTQMKSGVALVPSKALREAFGNVSVTTLGRWVESGLLPRPRRISGRHYWPEPVFRMLREGGIGRVRFDCDGNVLGGDS